MRIGIDLGGTKIEVIAMDLNGKVLYRERKPTPQGDYLKTVQTIANLVRQAELVTQQKGSVGVATPGALSPQTQLIKNSNSVCLIGKDLSNDLKSLLKTEVRLANDADCFTLSEAVDGVAKNQVSVFGVILGTGVGGGIVIDKKLLAGPNAITGEWGHNPLPWPNPESELPGSECYCGQRGCIETFLSGPSVERDYLQITGESLPLKTIVANAKVDCINHESAELVVNHFFNRLARSLAQIINILDPEIIVLGGGLSNISEIYTQVPELLPQFVFSDAVMTLLKPAHHGDSSGVRGAAWLWPVSE